MFLGESSKQLVGVESDVTKRLKKDQSETGDDRISNLPDDLIVDNILSRFSDSKFLIHSDVSFRKNAVEDLIDFGFGDKPFLEFFNAVNRTLSQYRLKTISKFQVNANYDARFASDVKSWIQLAVTMCVKDFTLYLSHSGDENTYLIKNKSFYNSSHFTTLDIGYCLFQPKDAIAWENITKLTISNSRLKYDLIPNIVSGSPLLHTLILRECHAYVIEIPSPSVKRLEIHGHEADDLETLLQIFAPYITDLIIVDSLWMSNISLTNVSSVVKAYLNFELPQFYYRVKKPYAEALLGGMITDLEDAKEVEIGVLCYPILRRLASKSYTLPPNVVGVDTSSIYYVDSDVDGSNSE